MQSRLFDVFKMKSSTGSEDFIIWGKHKELQDTEPLQPVTIMSNQQTANNNAVLANCDKIGTVCNDCLRQSVSRSINVITGRDKVTPIEGDRCEYAGTCQLYFTTLEK